MGKFYLRVTDEGKETARLYLNVHKRRPCVNLKIATPLYVDVNAWENANTSPEALNRFYMSADGRKLSVKMAQITEAIDSLLTQGITAKDEIEEAINEIYYKEYREAQRDREAKKEREQREQKERKRQDPINYAYGIVQGMKDGLILHKGRMFAPNTIKVWAAFAKALNGFYETNGAFTINSIDGKFADRFTKYLKSCDVMARTISAYQGVLRAFVRRAYDDGLHNDVMCVRSMAKARVLDDEKKARIYLTADEIRALYDAELKGNEDKARDIFLCGVYTCQRYSDFSRISAANFATTARGTRIVRVQQTKTGKTVAVPILNDNLTRIMEKYNYNLPKMGEIYLCRYIRDVLKRISKDIPSLSEQYETTLTASEKKTETEFGKEYTRTESGRVLKPKYELVGTHTARRSGITNLYLSGKFDNVQMMSISGHTSIKTFLEYIRVTVDDVADKISEIVNNTNEDLF